jgi:hypothetical protein
MRSRAGGGSSVIASWTLYLDKVYSLEVTFHKEPSPMPACCS